MNGKCEDNHQYPELLTFILTQLESLRGEFSGQTATMPMMRDVAATAINTCLVALSSAASKHCRSAVIEHNTVPPASTRGILESTLARVSTDFGLNHCKHPPFCHNRCRFITHKLLLFPFYAAGHEYTIRLQMRMFDSAFIDASNTRLFTLMLRESTR